MPIHPMSDINDYIKLKKSIKNQNDSERSGEQLFQREQTKSFQPLINVQKETSKSIKDNMAAGQELTVNTLLPLVQEMQRRNDQIDMLASQPFNQAQLPDIPEETRQLSVPLYDLNLIKDYNDSDIQNLADMSFELPGQLQKNYTVEELEVKLEEVFKNIKTKEHSLRSLKSSKKSTREGLTEMYNSQYNTLIKHRDRLEDLVRLRHLKVDRPTSTPKKLGEGIDIIICSNPAELYQKLSRFCAAKEAGNTGVDNHINTILDKLLEDGVIDRNDYKDLYTKIFH